MSKKDYGTKRNKELSCWKTTSKPLTPKYDKFDILSKVEKLKIYYPDTPIWNDLWKRVRSNIELTPKQLDAINKTHYRLRGVKSTSRHIERAK